MKKQKFYVVWRGVQPGIYLTWDEASRQVTGFPDARYKSFESRAEAEQAYRGNAPVYRSSSGPRPAVAKPDAATLSSEVDTSAMAVDAACAGVPGPMEYRGIWIATGEEVFHCGPMPDGTNNIGEFLAIVHAAAFLKREGRTDVVIYSDSRNAIGWVKAKVCRTKLLPTEQNGRIFELIDRAVAYLKENRLTNPILKWETRRWGENPADFGRK